MEAHWPFLLPSKCQDMRSRQRRMAAKIILDFRSEPAQVEVALCCSYEKGGLRVAILGSNFLHDFGRRIGRQNAYAGRVTREEAIRK